MNNRAIAGLFAAPVCWFLLGFPASNAQANRIKVHGTVYDTTKMPLDGVQVTIWRAGVPQQDVTRNGGTYEFSLAAGLQIDSIKYTKTNYDPGLVEKLSGATEQQISKILYRAGQARTLIEVADQIHAFEQIWYTAITAQPDARGPAIADLRKPEWLDGIRRLVIPSQNGQIDPLIVQALQARKTALEMLYSPARPIFFESVNRKPLIDDSKNK